MRALLGHDGIPGRPLRLYTPDNRRLDMSTETIVGQKRNQFKNWSCGAGVESLYVDMDGKVFVASCRVGGELGNIYDEITTPKQWLKCPIEYCSCGADLLIPKAKDEDCKRFLVQTFPESRRNFKPAVNKANVSDDFVALERTYDASVPQVYWELGRYCNYDCSYCWPFIHNKTDPHKTLEQLMAGTDLLEKHFVKGRKCRYSISGGEPTLNPHLLDWLKYIKSLGHDISMHSNGSRLPKYYLELLELTDINLSVHFEFYNKDKLIEVIGALALKKHRNNKLRLGHLELKLMMTPGRTQEILEFEKALKALPHFKEYCTWSIVPIREGDHGDLIQQGYTEFDFTLFGDRK